MNHLTVSGWVTCHSFTGFIVLEYSSHVDWFTALIGSSGSSFALLFCLTFTLCCKAMVGSWFIWYTFGQHLGFLLLLKYLSSVPSKKVLPKSYPTIPSDHLIKWEAERWL